EEKYLSDKQKTLIKLQKMHRRALSIRDYDKPSTLKQSISILDSILQICPGYTYALNTKYNLQYKLKDYHGMLKTNKVLNDQFSPHEYREFKAQRAKIFELLGEKDSADYYYKNVIKSYEDFYRLLKAGGLVGIVEGRMNYADCLNWYGDTQKATEVINEAKKIYGHNILKDYKFQTLSQKINQLNARDGADYSNVMYRDYSPCETN
ncbi:MAG: hypothetical protein MI922_20370, partial [Bacteroidales bacterium]|nr:hypothetical protein [Bacteroidales bacterium]